ncbi:MAG: dihydroorotase [Streptosporangiaceae bacterium]
MSIDRRISGGTVVLADGPVEADVLIADGKIAGVVDPAIGLGVDAAVTDATGKLVLPGMIDVHVHTREPGYTHKEDIATATMQAAAGGVTTIFGMPNLDPPTTTLAALQAVLELYREKSIVDWNHNPAATDPEQVVVMASAGVRAFKIYMVIDTGRTYPHPAGTGMHDHGHLLQMMDTIAPTGLRFIIHPHDQALMTYIEAGYLARGENTPAGYARAYAERDGVIWDTAVDVILRLAEASGCPIHIAHMQTRRSIEAVARAKARGVDVTCEVNHWALFLSTWQDVETLGPYALSYWVPDDARAAVWDALNDGVIDIVSSDHAPHTRDEKEVGWTRMWSAHTGTPGLQYYYPLLLDAAARNKLSLRRVVDAAAARPAEAFGLAGSKGRIAVGYDADLAIVDLNARWTVRNDGVLSRIGWTPYDGRTIGARVETTLVRGEPVFETGTVVGKPGGGRMAVPRPAASTDRRQ